MAVQIKRRKGVLGLFVDPQGAADAVSALVGAGYGRADFDILTGAPYPEGAFGEPPVKHRLGVFPVVGALCGLAVALMLTLGTQISNPLVTGGKPIIAIPPMLIVIYEGTMLGAILFTVLGIIFESRLPRFRLRPYDRRISEGYIGVLVTPSEDRLKAVEGLLQEAGAADIVRQGEGRGK